MAPTTNSVLADIPNNNSNSTNIARRIVKQLDLTDFQYNDVYSVPAPQHPSVFKPGPLDFIDYFEAPMPQQNKYQTPTWHAPYQHPTNYESRYQNGQSKTALSSATSEKNLDYVDDPIFVIIRANEKRNIDIAQSCNKWVFAPQTEKKVLQLISQEKKVYLVFYVKELQMFMGIAEYKHLNIGKNFSKPTATISWKCTSPLHRNKAKHLLNPYNEGKPIYDAQDGVVIKQDIGEELMRIYSEAEGVNMNDKRRESNSIKWD